MHYVCVCVHLCYNLNVYMLHCENYALAPPPLFSLPPSISCCDSCPSSRRVFVWSRTRPGPIPDIPVQRIRTEPPQLPLLYNQSLRFPLLDTQGNCIVHVPMWLIRIPSAVFARVLLSHSQLNARYVVPLQVTV